MTIECSSADRDSEITPEFTVEDYAERLRFTLDIIPPDMLSSVLDKVALRPAPEPLEPEVATIIQELIDEVKGTPRGKNSVTQTEQALMIFINKGVEGVKSSELQSLYEGYENAEHNAFALIERLSQKFKSRGKQVTRTDNIYTITDETGKSNS
jgi:hypothetical protein